MDWNNDSMLHIWLAALFWQRIPKAARGFIEDFTYSRYFNFSNCFTCKDGGDLFNDAVEYCRMPLRGRYVDDDDEGDSDVNVVRLEIDSLRRTLVGFTHSAYDEPV